MQLHSHSVILLIADRSIFAVIPRRYYRRVFRSNCYLCAQKILLFTGIPQCFCKKGGFYHNSNIKSKFVMCNDEGCGSDIQENE